MSEQPLYGLTCAGGGAHGAYQVGVLKYVHEHFCHGDHSPFQVFSGTSCGSLNTSFFATRSFDGREAGAALEALWIGFHVPAFHGNVLKNSLLSLIADLEKPRYHRKASWSLLDPQPLIDIIARGYVRADLQRALELGTTQGVAVSTTELRTSRLVWFQEGPRATSWVALESIGIEEPLLPHHIQASCSVPIVFPPVRIGDHYFSDGGVSDKRPLSPLVNMGATRILAVATDRPLPHHLPEYPPDFRPRLAETVRMLLGQLGHDYSTDQANTFEMVNFLYHKLPRRAQHIDPHLPPHMLSGEAVYPSQYQPVEVMVVTPSKRIRHTDIFHPDMFDPSLGKRSTVLLFHEEFTRQLIDFGYSDARARHDELARFFDRDRPAEPPPAELVHRASTGP